MQAHYLQFFSIEQKFEMTSQRGLLGSKANVKCDYCGREGRRDKISEHTLKDLGFEINPCILCVLLIFE